MKLVKSLLLGSAAGLAATVGAQAADLPVKAAAAVEYVRVCSAYGAGFFYIPGTDTCLRISGLARLEFSADQQIFRSSDVTGWRARARLNFDARTETGYGTLRSFIRIDASRRNGTQRSGSEERIGQAFPGLGVDFNGHAQMDVYIDKAFVQFAGLTAGRATSFFDFYGNSLNIIKMSGSDVSSTDVLAYTASFGGGFSATLAIEDPVERRQPLGPVTAFGGTLATGGAPAPVIITGFTPAGAPILTAVNPVQRNVAPDIVGNLRVDQAWGSAQLSGALHQLTIVGGGPTPVAGAATAPANFRGPAVDDTWGWAVQGGVKINLPFLAAGDQLWLQAAYTRGALSYTASGYLNIDNPTQSAAAGRFQGAIVDGIILQNGRIDRTRSFSAVGALLHYWTPQLRSVLAGTYTRFDYSQAASIATFGATPAGLAAAAASSFVRDWDIWEFQHNLIWSPVKDLDIGLALYYSPAHLSGPPVQDRNKAAGVLTNRDDQWKTRLRVDRAF